MLLAQSLQSFLTDTTKEKEVRQEVFRGSASEIEGQPFLKKKRPGLAD